MENEQYQKELFQEFEKPKRPLSGFAKIFSRTDFEHRLALTVTLEQLIFILIGAIMVMVALYAVGVERGKALKNNAIAIPTKKTTTVKAPTTAMVKVAKEQYVQNGAAQKIPPAQEAVKAYYTIIAYSYSSKETAVLQANYLKKAGFDAYISQIGKYFTVCIGKFPTKEIADPILKRVQKSIRKDAYLKYRQ